MSDAYKNGCLGALGEFRIIDEIIEPALAESLTPGERGDDAGAVSTASGAGIVVSCDAAPRPAVWDLLQRPWESWGWYAAAAALSDLAAAGTAPIGIVTSVEAPRSMKAADMRRFHLGLGAACRTFGVPHLGGNLRETTDFACHSTVIAQTEGKPMLGRTGCRPEDVLVVLGPCGEFAASYLSALRVGFSRLDQAGQLRLTRPHPQHRAVLELRRCGVEIQAATDNSDGLLGAIWNLAERSVCRMVLDLDAADLSQAVRDAAESTNIEPLRLGLMWGDWNVVACVRPDAYDILAAACRRARIEHRRIGRVVSGKPAIMRLVQGDYRPTRILRNEAFADWDYRTAPDAAVKRILHEPLDVADAPPT